MSVTSNRKITLQFSSDIQFSQEFAAAVNSSGSGNNVLTNLSSGANTISPPTGAKAVTIIPPSANAVSITLKGVTGDTGVGLHLTDPTSIGLASAGTFVLTTGGAITGLRLIYS